MLEMKTNLSKLKELEQPKPCYFVIDSIIEGHTPAQVYVDNVDQPTVSMIWEGNSVIFGGDLHQAKSGADWMRQTVFCEEFKRKQGFAKLYTPSQAWEDFLMEDLAEFEHKTIERVLFRHEFQQIPELIHPNADLEIRAIDREILESDLGNLRDLLYEVNYMWGSVEAFLEQAFGYCAIQGDEILCWCTEEYLSETYCGFGIETVEKYQQQGIAPLAAVACVRKAQELNLTPHWDSWAKNIPSVKVAEKVGFTRILDYNVIGVLLTDN